MSTVSTVNTVGKTLTPSFVTKRNRLTLSSRNLWQHMQFPISHILIVSVLFSPASFSHEPWSLMTNMKVIISSFMKYTEDRKALKSFHINLAKLFYANFITTTHNRHFSIPWTIT